MSGTTLGALSLNKMISVLGESALQQRGDGDTVSKHDMSVGDKCCE